MEIRRVQETGGGTLLVSLPKDWGRRYRISKGSFVAIEERSDGCLLLDPRPEEDEALHVVVIKYPFDGIEYMEWGLIGAYLLGYDYIQVEAERTIDSTDKARIKDAIQNLIGLEIMEETAGVVKAQCLIDPSLVDPHSLIQRMKVITTSMLGDTSAALLGADRDLARSVMRRDDEVDRIYFLLVRLLRSAVLTLKTSERFRITPLDCLDYRLVASLVESIADHTTSIAQELILKDSNLEGFRESLGRAFRVLEEMLELAIDGFLNHEIKALQEIRERYGSLTSLLDDFTGGESSSDPSRSLGPSLIFSYMKDIGRNCIDIADLIPPRQILKLHEKEAFKNQG